MNFIQRFRRQKEPDNLANGILRLVKERKHLSVMSILISEDVGCNWQKLIADCVEASGEPSFLHFLLKHNPPSEFVDMILAAGEDSDPCENSPDPHQDCRGRTPLHVAAEFGCESEVFEVLLKEGGDIQAMMVDREGRFPLHLLCTNPTGLNAGSLIEKLTMRESLSLLIDAYPKASITQDFEGLTPQDLAEKNGADKAFLEILEDAVTTCFTSKHNKGRSSSFCVPREVIEFRWSSEIDLSSLGSDGDKYDGDTDLEDDSDSG